MDTELRAGPLDVDGGLGAGVRDGGMLDLLVERGGAEPRELTSWPEGGGRARMAMAESAEGELDSRQWRRPSLIHSAGW